MSEDSEIYLVLMNMPDEHKVMHLSFEVNGIPVGAECCCYKLSSPLVEIRQSGQTVAFRLEGSRMVQPEQPHVVSLFDIYVFKDRTASLNCTIIESTGIYFYLSTKGAEADPVGCGEG